MSDLNDNDLNISPQWASFKRIWYFVAIALLLSLLALWLLGYGPGKGRQCGVGVNNATASPVNEGQLAAVAGTTATVLPSLSLKGLGLTSSDSGALRIPVGSSFSDAGANAYDSSGNSIKVDVAGEVDTTTAGEYVLTYTATDAKGNVTSKTRTVIVEAVAMTAMPTLTLKGSPDVEIAQGEEYVDAGATAVNGAGDAISVEVKGEVDTETSGEYMLTYTATDKEGNTSSAVRNIMVNAVADTTKPEVRLNGVSAKETAKAPETLVTGQHPRARLYFDFDRFTPAHDRKDELSGILQMLHSNADTKAYLSGYHDPKGNILYNIYLASQRARTVRSMLRKEGISADRIVMEAPTETEGTGDAREARRVEIMVR